MPGCRLDCGDQRRLTGNGSALEVVLHDYALYKSTFTLLYFTILYVHVESDACAMPWVRSRLTLSCNLLTPKVDHFVERSTVGYEKKSPFRQIPSFISEMMQGRATVTMERDRGPLVPISIKIVFFHFQNIVFTILATDAQTDERTVERICKNIILPARLTCWRHKTKSNL